MKEVRLPQSFKLTAELVQAITNQFPCDKLSIELVQAWAEKEALLADRLRDALYPIGSSAISYIRHNEKYKSTSQQVLAGFFASVLGALPSDMTDQVMSNWISSGGALREALEKVLIPSSDGLLKDALFSNSPLIKLGDYAAAESVSDTCQASDNPQVGCGVLEINRGEGIESIEVKLGEIGSIPKTKLEFFQPRNKIWESDLPSVELKQLGPRPPMSLNQLIGMIRQHQRGEVTPLLTSGDRCNLARVLFENEVFSSLVSLRCCDRGYWLMTDLGNRRDRLDYFTTWDRLFVTCDPTSFSWNPYG